MKRVSGQSGTLFPGEPNKLQIAGKTRHCRRKSGDPETFAHAESLDRVLSDGEFHDFLAPNFKSSRF